MPEKKERIEEYIIAEQITSNEYLYTLSDSRALLRYDRTSGLYRSDGETFVEALVEKLMAEYNQQENSTISFSREVIAQIKRQTYIERDLLNANPDLLVVKNGTLRLSDRCLLPHNPLELMTIGIPVRYDASARCPRIDAFLGEIVKPSDIDVLYEVCGWCLDRESNLQKVFLMVGEGGSGKSTFLNLIRALLGKENCSAVSLQQLSDSRFNMAELFGKLANVFPDLPSTGIRDISVIKGLTGGDTMMAEHKFEKPFTFMNTAKLVFSANELPRLPEDSAAIWRRFRVIEAPYQFKGVKEIGGFIDTLTAPEELSGFLNQSLDALVTLRAKNDFSTGASENVMRRRYFMRSNSVPVFIEERCVTDPKGSISKETLFQAFVQFCGENRVKPIGKNMFGARLNDMACATEAQDAYYVHIWKGITIKA
jgi:putative DNA primase/helicase